jgi:HYDIN/CFA65/VesB family protein
VSASGTGFSESGFTAPLILAAGQNTTLSAFFVPTAQTSYTGTLTITSTAASSPNIVSLSGIGIAATTVLNVSPTTLSFGNQVVNTTSTPQTVTLTNAGSTSITVSAVQASAPFTVNGFSSSTTLNAGQSLALAVAFDPTAQTSYTGTLTITSTAPSSPNTVNLSGTGISQPSVDLSPPNCGLTNDTSNHIPNATNWGAWMPPTKGGTYQDTELSPNACVVKRLTNARADGVTHLHYYSTIEPISLNDTKIFDTGSGQIIDFNGDVIVSRLPASNNTRFLWDRLSDMRYWQTNGPDLQLCTISSNIAPATVTCATNHTFTEYQNYMVNFMDETDQTPDGWLALVGQDTAGTNEDLFMFKPDYAGGANWTKAPVFKTPCTGDVNGPNNSCLHKLISTPNNGVAISGSAVGGTTYALWESPWTGLQSITDVGHFDSAKDLNGKEVLFCEDGQGATNFNPCLISMGSSDFNLVATLIPNGALPGWHVSSRDYPARPWGLYSAQIGPNGSSAEYFAGQGYVAPSSSNWKPYTNEIVLVRVDNAGGTSQLYRIAWTHARTVAGGDFWQDPRATISWDGRYVLFDSAADFANTGCGSIGDCADIYLIGPLF